MESQNEAGGGKASTAVGTLIKLKPELRLARAISEFSFLLVGDRDKHTQFKNLQTRSPPGVTDVVQLTEEINRDGALRHTSWRPNGTRLVAVLERLLQFAAVGDVLIGGAQNMIASGVWAAVRMALEVSLGFLSYFDKVSDMLMRIGRSLTLHRDFVLLFPSCHLLQGYMCEYTIVMVDVCKKIVTYTQKSFASQVASSFMSSFDSAFKPFEKDLSEWGRMIEKRTMWLVAESTLQEQSSSATRFDRLQMVLSKNTMKRERDARKHQLLKHLCPDQKEFDAIWRRERKRGTSSWILKHPAYHAWRDSITSTALWLQGNLGSGKTVTMATVVADLIMTAQKPGTEKRKISKGNGKYNG